MALALAAMLLTSIQTSRYTIALKPNHFVVTSSSSNQEVGQIPLAQKPPSQSYAVNFSAGNITVNWDKKGLSITGDGRPDTTQFREIPTSPRLRTRKDIEATLLAAHTQGRKLTASALSGWQESGTTVFMLIRWQDKPGYAWLEALIKIDLGDATPRPETVALLPGVTFSSQLIDTKLMKAGKDLVAYIHSGPTWGRWSFNPATHKSNFLKIGTEPKYINGLKNGQVQAVEKTAYGSFNASLYNGSTGSRICHIEFETMPKFISADLPSVVELASNTRELINLSTGALKAIPADSRIAPIGSNLFIWTGGDQPQNAWILSPAEWSSYGDWSQAASGN